MMLEMRLMGMEGMMAEIIRRPGWWKVTLHSGGV